MKRIVADQHEQVATWVFSKIPMATLGDSPYTAIGYFDPRGYLTAGTVYSAFTGNDLQMHHAQLTPRSITLRYLQEAFRYPFDQLKVRRVTVTVAEGNEASLRFVRHLGFVDEGRVREFFDNGDDAIILGMLRSECRYLTGAPHGKHHGRSPDAGPRANAATRSNDGRTGTSTLPLGGRPPDGRDWLAATGRR